MREGQSSCTRDRPRVVERERVGRTREEQSPSTRDRARVVEREKVARTREEQSPSTRDRARAANRERSTDAFASMSQFQQRTQQLGEAFDVGNRCSPRDPAVVFPTKPIRETQVGSVTATREAQVGAEPETGRWERDSGVDRYQRGDVSGLRQRREGEEVRGDDVECEGNGGGRSGAGRDAFWDGVYPRLRGLSALFSIGEPHVS